MNGENQIPRRWRVVSGAVGVRREVRLIRWFEDAAGALDHAREQLATAENDFVLVEEFRDRDLVKRGIRRQPRGLARELSDEELAEFESIEREGIA